MITTQILCDSCKKPINPAANSIQLKPLRGGLTINVKTQAGTGSKQITEELNLCNGNCVNALIADIKPVAAAAK